MADGSWLWRPYPRPSASIRLFCLPCAGGGASVFRDWPNRVPSWIEICAVQLPGREARLGERAFRSMEALVSELHRQLASCFDRPFAFFGHSMGALIAFELSRLLRVSGTAEPAHLVVAGSAPPHAARSRPPLHGKPDEEVIAELERLNGTPPEVLSNRELIRTLLPMLRADFALCETYRHRPGPRLTCPIAVLGGDRDSDLTPERLWQWRRHTAAACTVRMMPGDHFFVYAADSPVAGVVATELRNVCRLAASA